jgi:hypothetical protein
MRAGLCFIVVLLTFGFASSAHAATINSIAFSADPTEEEPVTVTVSGTSEANRSLFVYRQTGSCSTTAPAYGYGSPLTPSAGDALTAGSFSKSYAFTPTSAGSYRICAYVSQDAYTTAAAVGTAAFNVRLPAATVSSIALSADPTEEEPVTVTVSGTSEANRSLFVYRQTGSCSTTAPAYGYGSPLTPSAGDALTAGSFSKSYAFTPTSAGSYRICAYVSQDAYTTALAVNAAAFNVRFPAATISSIAFSADATENEPVSVTVSGSTEATRSLFVYRQAGTCSTTAPAYGYGSPLTPSAGDTLTAGSFTRSYTFTTTSAGSYRICAYVSQDAYTTALGGKEAPLNVRLPTATAALAVPAYLAGETVNLAATGVVEHDAEFAYTSGTGERGCEESAYSVKRTPVPAGAYSVPVAATFGTDAAYTFCLYVFDGDRKLTVQRVIARKRPLDAPALREATLAGRRPTFAWASSSSGTDTLVLSEDGTPFLNVNRDGGLSPSEAGEEEISDVEDYYDDEDDDDAPKADPELGRIVARPDGTAAVELGFSLPPGRYTWQVVRTRDAGERVASAARPLRVVGPPLSRLQVSTAAHRGKSSANPGYTTLKIQTTPYVKVRLTLRRAGREQRMVWRWGAGTTGSQRVEWSCKTRGKAEYRYTVEAEDVQGTIRRRSGRFASVSRARCNALVAAERRARAVRRAAEKRRAAERRRIAADQRARTRRFISNCNAAGGTPVRVQRAWGSELMCRAPYGGFLYVPM